MMPLAVFLKRSGANVFGSDRSYDQGKTPEKFKALQDLGIKLYPQDGSGVTQNVNYLVVSTAIEDTIPDIGVALAQDIPVIKRGMLLAELFNEAKDKIAVAGTSGKSTTTGMIASILVALGEDPSFVNGGEVLALRESKEDRFSSVRYGRPELFVAEMDESDGSIAHYNPSIAVLNNIALDHKSMEELEQLFGDYLARSSGCVVVNADQSGVMDLCSTRAKAKVISYGIENEPMFQAEAIEPKAQGIDFVLTYNQRHYDVSLSVSGRHNVENALAAIAACVVLGFDVDDVVQALDGFTGIHRRMEFVGVSDNGITVIDDFAHNPDKISASLRSLKDFDGRLIVMFQPHGFGPLYLMGKDIVQVFAHYMGTEDILVMPEVYYAGGTVVDSSVTARHIIDDVADAGIDAHWFETRDEAGTFIISQARAGDRVVIMGARDDTLHVFAQDVLGQF